MKSRQGEHGFLKGTSKKLDQAETEVYIGLCSVTATKRALILYGLLRNQELCINFNNAIISGHVLGWGQDLS